jgi:4-amino-4-deoxy-L-arabinose transferase-like glycosyltransferase
MKYRLILFLLLGIDAFVLFFEISHISIASSEASLLYGDFSFLQLLLKTSLAFFGQNDFGLRFIFIMMHIASALLMYEISKEYLKSERNRLWLVLTFILLPGVVSAAIMVNHAGFIIFGLLLYLYLEKKTSKIFINILLFVYALIDVGFVYLFLALALYHLFRKKAKREFAYNIGLFALSSYLYGFDIYGFPRGHFLDTIGVYSAIFTPVIFVYLIYVLYRRYLAQKRDKLWYIASTALIFSLLISFRQRVDIEHFAPYLIVALPLAAQTFASAYRVRLKEHRSGYRAIFVISFVLLIINTLLVFFNKELYLVLDNPKKNFAYNMHIAKELAEVLKKEGYSCVKTDKKMQKRLRFYGINSCAKNRLKEVPLESKVETGVTISYKNRILYKATVTKLNNNKSN